MISALESWLGVSLQAPWLLLLWLLIPLAGLVRWRLGRSAVFFAPTAVLGRNPPLLRETTPFPISMRVRSRVIPIFLQMIAAALGVVALARPVERAPLPLRIEGIDIVLCLDVSSSMKANDLDPKRTRLDVVKEAAARFIEDRPQDQIGLVAFARYPDLLCPPTLDHAALSRILADLEVVESDTAEDATGIGTAITRAETVLQSSDARSKVVILLTDGEENVASADRPEEIAPIHAAQLGEQLGIRVYTIAAGKGRPSAGGEWIPLDTEQVRTVAERTGGRFFEAKDASDVTAVYGDIDALEKVQLEAPRYRLEDRFLPWLLAAIGLWLFGWLLRQTFWRALP
ncbi:MAG: VWA domain-containing protein [Planctomycetota bacterium]